MLLFAILAAAGPGGGLAVAEDSAAPSELDPAQLVATERARAAVEAALEGYAEGAPNGDALLERVSRLAEGLAGLGQDVVPFLASEVDQDRRDTFEFAAYTLGLIAGPGAEAALRRAVERAERDAGQAALQRKSFACYALSLQGQVDALGLLDQGKREAAWIPVHGNFSTFEAAALHTAPRSTPVLLDMLARRVAQGAGAAELVPVLRAIRAAADPAAAEAVLALLEHDDADVRGEAAWTLGGLATPACQDALYGVLAAPDPALRLRAALALEATGAPGRPPALLSALRTETETVARGALYRLLSESPVPCAEGLCSLEPPADPRERLAFVAAVGRGPHEPARARLLRAMLSDPDNGVAREAALLLGQLGDTASARALEQALRTERLAVVRIVVDQLARLDRREAAPAIAARLTAVELASAVGDPFLRLPLSEMAEALVSLGHHRGLEDLRAAIARQTDAPLVESLEHAAAGLDLLRQHGSKLQTWIDLAAAPDAAVRELAWRQLGRAGGEPAAAALGRAFETADGAGRLSILRGLRDASAPSAAALVRRVLLDPAFDAASERPLRAEAAWILRRAGGPDAFSLLEAAARRRSGRDFAVLAYAAAVGGERALPLLADLGRTRMRYLGWERGAEREELERTRRRLAHGLPVTAALDLPPERLRVGR